MKIMKLNMYTLYDSAAKAYTQPFFTQSDGLAVRMFSDNVNSKTESNISLHPDQFTLYKLGVWDDKLASVDITDPISLGNGKTYVVDNVKKDDILNAIDSIRKDLLKNVKDKS